MEVEYGLLHDIVVKSLSAKAGSFDVVTTKRFEMMQSPGYAVQLSILLEKLVKAYLGEFVALHPLKVLNNKSVLTYMKKKQAAPQAGEVSKISGDKAEAAAEPKKEKPTKKLMAGSSVALATSHSETSSDADELLLATLALQPEIKKKRRTKRPKLVKPIPAEVEKAASKDLPLPVVRPRAQSV
ncbi:hypothetical protein F511_11974 [Dorcoceras hygrometricum]|uniref:Uncharacterized protein n=1 Tax=Dorcoceras hygrometricum TaxID=472368 RepID=A0A2Z7BTP1_9LAMI|nr:hypothetical protein F511_11974 [Dorcoceras hygrometricum]